MVDGSFSVRRLAPLWCALCWVLVCLVWAAPARAFMPDPGTTSSAFASMYASLASWQVVLTPTDVLFVDDEAETGDAATVGAENPDALRAIYYRSGTRFRYEWAQADDAGTYRLVAAAVGVVTPSGERITAAWPQSLADSLPQTPFVYWCGADLVSFLQRMGVRATPVGYDFVGTRPALLFKGDAACPECRAFVDADRPALLGVDVAQGTSPLRVRWADYELQSSVYLPREVRLSYPGGGAVTFTLGWSSINEPQSAERFDAAAFATRFNAIPDPQQTKLPAAFAALRSLLPAAIR